MSIVVYFDFISPFSYIAFKLLEKVKRLWDVSVHYVPVRLPHIIKMTNNTPPASVIARAKFLGKDLSRTAAFYGIPYAPPKSFLTVSMRSAGLVLIVINEMVREGTLTEQNVSEYICKVWEEFFGNANTSFFTTDPQDLTPVLIEVFPQEIVNVIIERAKNDSTATRMIENTDEALAAGAFGAPTILVTKDGKTEFFFGSDRFHHIAIFLGKDTTTIYNPAELSKL
jgi:glutathione S-transferase kappa 1